jgi:hypothetical protein
MLNFEKRLRISIEKKKLTFKCSVLKISCFYKQEKKVLMLLYLMNLGERRGSNPRIVESQSTALPLGYARHFGLKINKKSI